MYISSHWRSPRRLRLRISGVSPAGPSGIRDCYGAEETRLNSVPLLFKSIKVGQGVHTGKISISVFMGQGGGATLTTLCLLS
jgi:hypothetical protein